MDSQQNKDFLEDQLGVPKAKKSSWKVFYTLLGILFITAMLLAYLYRVTPKKTEPIAKRKIPATSGVYVVVLSKVDPVNINRITDNIQTAVGKDSAMTKMVLGSTFMYKQCTSLAEYKRLLTQAMTEATPTSLKNQGLLISQMVGILTNDLAPSRFYLVGSFADTTVTELEKRFLGISKVLYTRNEVFGKTVIVNELLPRTSASSQFVMNLFKKQNLPVIEQ
jgi:hypothetical protein